MFSLILTREISVYALRALLKSLAPLIGCEEESGHAVSAGWAEKASQETIDNWTEKGMEIEKEMADEIEKVHSDEYWGLMRKVRDLFSLSLCCDNPILILGLISVLV